MPTHFTMGSKLILMIIVITTFQSSLAAPRSESEVLFFYNVLMQSPSYFMPQINSNDIDLATIVQRDQQPEEHLQDYHQIHHQPLIPEPRSSLSFHVGYVMHK
jgi:hypothetical protein